MCVCLSVDYVQDPGLYLVLNRVEGEGAQHRHWEGRVVRTGRPYGHSSSQRSSTSSVRVSILLYPRKHKKLVKLRKFKGGIHFTRNIYMLDTTCFFKPILINEPI